MLVPQTRCDLAVPLPHMFEFALFLFIIIRFVPRERPITPGREGQLLRVILRAFKQKETPANNTNALIDRHQTE